MKASIKVLLLCFLTPFFSLSYAGHVPTSLKKCFIVMNSLRQVHLKIGYRYIDDLRSDTATINSYIDFKSRDSLIGVRYFYEINGKEVRFDGSSKLAIHHNEQLVVLNEQPDMYDLSNDMGPSKLIMIKKLLPQIADSSWCSMEEFPITNVFGQDLIPIKFTLTNHAISLLEYEAYKTLGREISYWLYLDPEFYLPVVWDESEGGETHITRFMNYDFDWPGKEDLWIKDIVPKSYRFYTNKEYTEYLMGRVKFKVDGPAPNFSLLSLDGQKFTLEALRGKPVLLEFWFPGCSGCVQCIDRINRIYEQHIDNGLEILGIQFVDLFEKGVRDYVKEENIKIPILLNGAETAKKYGVLAAPTFIFINAEGNVVKAIVGCNEKELRNGLRMLGM